MWRKKQEVVAIDGHQSKAVEQILGGIAHSNDTPLTLMIA